MGRLSKFKFPIPGRKQRQNAEPQPPQPEVYATNMKAHKLLGTTAINVDTSTQWDAASNSGISIAVSESTASHHPSERRGARGDAGARARSQWGEESETIPSHLQVPPVPSGYNVNGGPHDASEAPNLRKRQSNSTIMSYYDKSRVPLSISQQTSASAMAKGLPSKANSVLDIDGTNSHPVRKTKPPKLDTGVLSRPRTGASNRSDHDIYSPSSTQHPLSPMSSRATLSSVKTERDRKSTMQRLHEFTGRRKNSTPGPVPAPAPVPEMPVRGANISHDTGLNHLYDHYEQMSFKQVMGEQEDIPEGLENEVEDEQPPHEPEMREPHAYNHQHSKAAPPSRGALDVEYATSISSRHTRTSKASKKTSPSFMDSDLHQRSVLSLSSDSEDDGYVEQPKPSPRPPRSRGAMPENEPIPMSEHRQSVASKSSANSAVSGKSGVSGRSGLRASFTSRNAFLTIPTEPLPPCPPEISRRTSSLARRASTASSQVSGISTSTAGSASQHLQDARLMTRAPAAAQFDRRSKASAQSRRTSGRSEQLTPPLSPSSVEFYMTPPEGQDPRFIAVSRQEEMLLSALRMKRARMRGGTLGELEEEGLMDALPEGKAADRNPRDSARGLQKKGSKSSVSTARTETPRSEMRSSRQGAPRSASASATTRKVAPPASTTSEPAAPKRKLSLRHQPSREPPKGTMLDLDEEPSPDLSDFLEPDNGSEEADTLSSRGRSTGPKTPVTPSDVTPEAALGQQGGKRGVEGLRVVTEEGDDVPRPDSPISPKFSLFPVPGGRKGVRLSAVGGIAGMEATWWGDDG